MDSRGDLADRRWAALLGAVMACATCGCQCGTVPPDPLDSGADSTSVQTTDAVDILFVVGNTGTMTEEQFALASAIERLIAQLESGDIGGDGTVDVTPVRTLRIGVIDTDMGTGHVASTEHCSAGFGDDGLLRNVGAVALGCESTFPSAIFAYAAETSSAARLAADVSCVAVVGTDGCGFEQQLEATLKATAPRSAKDGSSTVAWTRAGYVPPVFLGGTEGHSGPGGANEGLIRDESVLAIIMLTDEDDCSTGNPAIFDLEDPRYRGIDSRLRCSTLAAELHPVERYVDGLLGLRRDPSDLVFAAIVGVPVDVGEDPDLDAVLALPSMMETIDPVLGNQLMRSCDGGPNGPAYPPRRIVTAARDLQARGVHVVVTSLCARNYWPAADEITATIGRALAGAEP